MLWRRILYVILTLASVIAFILTDNGVALFFCLCLVCFPVLSYILLLFAKRKLEFDFTVRSSCMRGGALQITMHAKLSPRFLAGYVKATGFMENTTFDKTDRKTFVFQDMSNKPHTFEYVSADSGRIIVHFPTIRITDILGVCTIGVKCGKHAEAIVSPVLYDEVNVRMGNSSKSVVGGDLSLSQKGYDHTEVFGIRDYIPGDLLNSVHWKLSGKFDDIKTKEYGSSDDRHTLILVDMTRIKKANAYTPDEWLNCVLDIAASVSGALIKNNYAHTVGWINDGKFFCADVTDNDSFVQAVEKLMSNKISVSTEGNSLVFAQSHDSVFTKIIYVAAAVDISVAKGNIDHDLTILSVTDSATALENSNAKFIGMPCDGISEALSIREL